MDFLVVALPILGFLMLIAGIIYLVWRHEKNRRLQFEAVSGELGLQFYPKGKPDEYGIDGNLKLFNRGRGRRMTNIVMGTTADVDLSIFGYRFTTGSGKNSTTHHQSVIRFRSPLLSLPEFQLGPEGVFSKIGQAFGYKDIDFDSHPEFSKRFLLRGEDEEAIRQVFTPQVLGFFEPRAGDKLKVEAVGDQLIVYRARKRIKPEELREFMQLGFEVYGAFK